MTITATAPVSAAHALWKSRWEDPGGLRIGF
jgi:hypothetical protein